MPIAWLGPAARHLRHHLRPPATPEPLPGQTDEHGTNPANPDNAPGNACPWRSGENCLLLSSRHTLLHEGSLMSLALLAPMCSGHHPDDYNQVISADYDKVRAYPGNRETSAMASGCVDRHQLA